MQEKECIKQKQQYLFKQIIEAGFDPEQFQEFLEQRQGLDLDNWTMKELISAVKQFKKIPQQQNIHQNIDHSLSSDPPLLQQNYDNSIDKPLPRGSALMQEDNAPINNTSLYRYYTYQLKPSTQLYKAIQKQKPIISKASVNITAIKKSFAKFFVFQTSFVDYQIQTKFHNVIWKVDRRYNEFKWFRQTLIKLYPNLPMPPIPSKTTVRSFDEKHLENRKQFLQKFLNKVIQSPQLASDSLTQVFLKISDNQEYLSEKKKYEKVNKQAKIYSIYSQSQSNEESQSINELQQVMDKLSINSQIYERLSEKAQQTDYHLSLLERSYSQMGEIFFKLQKSQQSMKGNNLYTLVKQYINQTKKWIKLSQSITNKYIKQAYQFQSKYLNQYIASIHQIRRANSNFSLKFKNIFKIYQHGEIPVLDSGPTNNLNANYLKTYQKEKEDYKISLYHLIREVKRYNNQTLLYHGGQWLKAYRIYMQGIGQSMMSGADLLTKAISAHEGKNLIEVEIIKN